MTKNISIICKTLEISNAEADLSLVNEILKERAEKGVVE
jgi:hypothetical protein